MPTNDVSWLRRADPWIWGMVVAAGCWAAASLLKDRPAYEAHAAIEVDQIDGSDALILRAARQAGLHKDAEFNRPAGNAGLIRNTKQHLSLKRDGAAHLFHIRFRASDPHRAAAFANALIDAYADDRLSRNVALAAELTERLEALASAIQTNETKLAEVSGNAASDTLIEDTNRLQRLYNSILGRAAATRALSPFFERAQVPLEPVDSNPWKGLVFGVPLILIGGWLYFASRRRLRDLPEPAFHADVMRAPEEADKPVVALSNAGTGFNNPETLLDFVESLLAVHKSILVIDCEMGGALTEWVGLRGEAGLSNFLMANPDDWDMIPAWKTNRAGVSVMPAGTQPNRLPLLLSQPYLREALAVLLAAYDRVVINAPAILTTGEMRDLSPMVDGVILVTPRERSLDLAAFAVRQVEEFGGRVIGLVEDPDQLAVA